MLSFRSAVYDTGWRLLLSVAFFLIAGRAFPETIFALSTSNQLLSFNSATPGTIIDTLPITGLQGGETLIGIEFRPSTGRLYGLTNGRLYTIDTNTGAATLATTLGAVLSAETYGMDFNPVSDTLRVVSEADQNFQINPATGLVNIDMNLAFAIGDLHQGANPFVTAVAYLNSFPGASVTTLFDIDSDVDSLLVQEPENNGRLTTKGPLGVNPFGNVEFDIAPDGDAFIALKTGLITQFYTVNLNTGMATLIGNVGDGFTTLAGLAVAPPGQIRFSAASYTATERGEAATIKIERIGGAYGSVSVEFDMTQGTADFGDFSGLTGPVLFGPGVTEMTFTIAAVDDALAEDLQTASMSISSPTGGAVLGHSNAVLVVADDEIPPRDLRGLGANNSLLLFRSSEPGKILGTLPVTGLPGGEVLRGIDIRPADGKLYALGNDRLYSINTASGLATAFPSNYGVALSGATFGMDFNPFVDRLRVVSNLEQNLRINPNTGFLTAVDAVLNYAAGDMNAGANPNVAGVAYFNNNVGTTSTILYDIDAALDVLAIQNPPNNGTLNTVGALNINATAMAGFDISPQNTALAALIPFPALDSSLYRIDLATGAAELIGPIGVNLQVRGLAIDGPVPRNAARHWDLFE